jgi:hypothetical protein
MYIVMESSDSTTAAGTPTTPTDWTKLFENTVGAGATGVTTLTIFGKIAGASEANVTVSGVGNHCAGAMIVIAGHGLAHITATVVGEPTDNGTGTTGRTISSINGPADSLIIGAIGLSDDANDTTNMSNVANANLTGLTEHIDQTVSTGAGGGVCIHTGACAGTSSGSTTWDHDTAERAQSVHLGVPPTGVSPRLIQKAGGTADNTTSVVVAYPADVVTGDLLVIAVVKYSPSDDAFVVGDISKSAGTATLGSFTLDQNVNFDFQASSDRMAGAIYSAPVTAGGSCTITVGGAVAGSFLVMSVSEWEGLDTGASRLEDSDTGTGASGAPATATATSAGAALFAGIVLTNYAVVTTHTPGADYNTLFESEDGATHATGSAEYRVVTAGTTDAADWVAPTTSDYACALAVYKAATAAQEVTGAHLASTFQTFAPSIVGEGAVAGAHVASALQLFPPTLRYAAVGTFLASTLQLFSPVVQHTPAWPLRASTNGRYLEDQRSIPFLVNGTAVWSLTHNLTLSEATNVLDRLKAKGLNSVIVSAPDSFDESGTPSDPVSDDKQGNQPFTSNDLTQPIEAYWSHVDDVLDACKARNFLVYFTPLYLGFSDTEGFRDVLASNSVANATTYGEFLGTRYGGLGNLVWLNGGDVAPTTWASKVRAIQDGIISTASVSMPHATHWGPDENPWDFTTDFAESRFQIHNVYTYNPVGNRTNDSYNHSPTKPTIFLETDYEGAGGDDIWAEPYRAMFSGAMGHFSGNIPLWYCGDNNGGWSAALDSTGFTRLAHLWELFNARQWWKLVPSRDGALMTSGNGNPDLDSGCQGALTADQKLAMIFFPSQLTVTVDLTAVDALGAGSSIQADWFNTRTGEVTSDGSYGVTGTHNFTPPSSSSEFVLVLTSDVPPATDSSATGAHRASSLQLFAGTLRHVVVGVHRASTLQLFAPTVAPGAVTIAGAHLSSTLQVFPGTLAVGAVTVSGAHLGSGLQLFAPTVSQGGATQDVTGVHRASTLVVNAPTLTHIVAGAHLGPALQVFAPTLSHAAVGAHVSSAFQVFAPALAYRIVGAHVASTLQTFTPTTAYRVAGAHRTSALQVFAPTVSTFGTISGANVPSTLQLFSGTASAGPVAVQGAHVSSSLAVFSPSVSRTVAGAHLGLTLQLFAPSTIYRVSGAHVGPTLTLFAPTITTFGTIAGAHAPSTLQLFAPTVTPASWPIVGAHSGSTLVVFTPTLGYVVAGAHRGPMLQVFSPTVSGGIQYLVISQPGAGSHGTSLGESRTSSALNGSRNSTEI